MLNGLLTGEGDRAANSALHLIVLTRKRYCTRTRTRTYVAREIYGLPPRPARSQQPA